ncbi:MAG: MarR family transcriptional regulator [Defluviitaleaceae bacterium]|nr:MarR family transcriptional regulator [Defluviitaleaceae bacterium]
MSRIRHLSGRVWEDVLKESGVEIFNGAQGRILYVLWEKGDMTISQIGKLTSLAKTTLTGMLDRMEASGLIKRVPDKKNRRQIYVTVSQKAREYRDIYDGISDRMNGIYYRGFSDKEVADFEGQLKRIVSNLEEEENKK